MSLVGQRGDYTKAWASTTSEGPKEVRVLISIGSDVGGIRENNRELNNVVRT